MIRSPLRRTLLKTLTLPAALVGCVTAPPAPVAVTSPTLLRFRQERDALRPLFSSEAAQSFLLAVDMLPAVAARTVYQNTKNPRTWLSSTAFAALPAEQKLDFAARTQDENAYYSTFYGSPLAYVRAIDIGARFGVRTLSNIKVLDYGYGAIGGLRLMAGAGANVVGLDVDAFLSAIYTESSDVGPFMGKGSVSLIHGFFPNDAAIVARAGENFDVIMTKNTMKKGFMRPRSGNPMIPLNMAVADYLRRFADALKPGGVLVVYNIGGAPRADRYLPSTDIDSPFTREEYVAAGLEVMALNESDDNAVRKMGSALGWDKSMGALETNLFASFTVVRKPN
jgi:SAM-dependent methyltransferase